MKIISKYKDFYDYIVQDHDADITFVRNIGLVNEYFDNLFNKEGRHLPYFNKYCGYHYSDSTDKYAKDGDITLGSYLFGI